MPSENGGEFALHRDLVVIGTSAGGLRALREIVSALPGDLPAALFVVMHSAPEPRSGLADILSGWGPLPAHAAVHGERIRSGRIYVAPNDNHLTLHRDFVRVTRGPKENGHRPAVDSSVPHRRPGVRQPCRRSDPDRKSELRHRGPAGGQGGRRSGGGAVRSRVLRHAPERGRPRRGRPRRPARRHPGDPREAGDRADPRAGRGRRRGTADCCTAGIAHRLPLVPGLDGGNRRGGPAPLPVSRRTRLQRGQPPGRAGRVAGDGAVGLGPGAGGERAAGRPAGQLRRLEARAALP